MLPSKGPIQPHPDHLPRRPRRSHSIQNANAPSHAIVDPPEHQSNPSTPPHHPQAHIVHFTPETPSSSTRSTVCDSSEHKQGKRIVGIATPLTSPSDVHCCHSPTSVLPPTRFPPHAAGECTPPLELRHLHIGSRPRGHSEPHLTNLPRRTRSKDKKRERVRDRCLQEVFKGSGFWIAFSQHDREERHSINAPDAADWMWDDQFGFTAVIRVRITSVHEDAPQNQNEDDRKAERELDLTIEQSDAEALDDSGVSALTAAQFQDVARFLDDHYRSESSKILILVPRSRPVEALSLALFALSRPFSAPVNDSSSFLSRLRFLPGILDLQPDHNARRIDPHTHSATGSLMQLALWHLHDLPVFGENGVHDELKSEWRGSLSLDGIQKLEAL